MAIQRIAELPPPELPALPQFAGLHVEAIRPLSSRDHSFRGIKSIATHLVSMSDGSRYIEREVVPVEQRSDVRVEMMTALATRVSGFNTQCAELGAIATGSEVAIIGSNQSTDVETSLAQDAYAANLIMIARDEMRGRRPLDTPVVSWGKSRGGMGGNGKLAYAPLMGRDIAFALHEDPCLTHATGIKETITELTPMDVAHELMALGRGLQRREGETRREATSRVAGMFSTFGVSRKYVDVHIHTGRAIWRGDAGVFLDHIQPQQAMITIMMNKNTLNHRIEYGQHMAAKPYSYIIDRDYWHLMIGRRDIVEIGASALATTVRMLDMGVDRPDIAKKVKRQLERALPKTE